MTLTFAHRIIRARLLFGAWADTPREVGYAEVAMALGVTPGNVGHWESGRHTPGRENAAKLADYFGVRVEWLEHGRGEMYEGGGLRPLVEPSRPTPSPDAGGIPELDRRLARTLVGGGLSGRWGMWKPTPTGPPPVP